MGLFFNYTPQQWKKYTTSEERSALRSSSNKLADIILKASNFIPAALVGGAVSPVVMAPAYLLAAATPTWSIKEVKEWGDNPNTITKSKWIPGYYTYSNAKIIGAQLGVQRRVEQQALNENNNNRKEQ
jgi:hypothetical protein